MSAYPEVEIHPTLWDFLMDFLRRRKLKPLPSKIESHMTGPPEDTQVGLKLTIAIGRGETLILRRGVEAIKEE